MWMSSGSYSCVDVFVYSWRGECQSVGQSFEEEKPVGSRWRTVVLPSVCVSGPGVWDRGCWCCWCSGCISCSLLSYPSCRKTVVRGCHSASTNMKWSCSLPRSNLQGLCCSLSVVHSGSFLPLVSLTSQSKLQLFHTETGESPRHRNR